DSRRDHRRRTRGRTDHHVDACARARAQYPRDDGNRGSLSDFVRNRETRGDHLFFVKFDELKSAAAGRLPAPVRVRYTEACKARPMASQSTADNETAASRALRFGLSGKLLLLTIMFVMIAEVLIYVPSIANFRLTWLGDRAEAARTVAVLLTSTEDAQPREGQNKFKLPDDVVTAVLGKLGATTLAIKMGNQRKLLAINDAPQHIHHDVDLRTSTKMMALWQAMEAMFLCSDADIIRVVDHAGDI